MTRIINTFLDACMSNISISVLSASSFLSLLISPLIESFNLAYEHMYIVFLLMTLDIIFGILSYRKKGERFSCKKLKNSIILIGVIMVFILIAHRIDQIKDMEMFSVLNWFTLAICMVYFYSSLINAGHVFNIPFLIKLSKLFAIKVKDTTNIDLKELHNENKPNRVEPDKEI